MAEKDDSGFDEFLAIRKPGAHLEEDDFVLQLRVDLKNYQKFRRVDDQVTYRKADLDIRQQLDVESGAELPDCSGPQPGVAARNVRMARSSATSLPSSITACSRHSAAIVSPSSGTTRARSNHARSSHQRAPGTSQRRPAGGRPCRAVERLGRHRWGTTGHTMGTPSRPAHLTSRPPKGARDVGD
jgi:hypothetical protein